MKYIEALQESQQRVIGGHIFDPKYFNNTNNS